MKTFVLSLGLLCLLFLYFTQVSFANEIKEKDIVESNLDTVRWMRRDTTSQWYQRQLRKARKVVHRFNEIDTTYIEPQRYNFTVMLQNTNTYEHYRLSSSSHQSISLAPRASIKIGPYFGWRWIFLGYTLDVRLFDLFSGSKSTKQEYDLSLYTSMIGIDLYYRKTGSDFKIRQLYLGKDINTETLRGVDFGGLSSSIRGFNIYYIFNHRHFSYPAAFSQSTVQRKSAGSPLIGVGYTSHKLSVNWDELNSLIHDRLQGTNPEAQLDSTIMFEQVKYKDISISGGYAYNWVFKKNWLLAASLSLALAYKTSSGDLKSNNNIGNFDFKNINIDAIGRFGLVYNNSKWYAGMSAILHAYNYRKENFSTNNFFGSVNLYAGLNFGRKKASKKKKKL